MELRTLKEIEDLSGKRVFVRVDFNVPLGSDGSVKDDKRIRHALPTLKYLLKNGASQLILATHVGRPKGQEEHLKTNVQAERLADLLRVEVQKIDDWGEGGVPNTPIVLLENLRFHPAEKSKDETVRDAFGKQLASLADIYVNEAFSNSHRSHASMTSVPKFIPGFAGLGLEHEVQAISQAMQSPQRPVVAVIGGLKADKLPAVHHLMHVADHVLVAGALACNLLKAKGYEVGDSKVDDEGMADYSDMAKAINVSKVVQLPTDFVVADAFSEAANYKSVSAKEIKPGWMALDIGPQSAEHFSQLIQTAKTVLWFGPIGVFEFKPFAHGTQSIAEAMVSGQAMTIVGGGDSASAVKKLGFESQMSLVSTGGGASLEMIEGKVLPGLKVLSK